MAEVVVDWPASNWVLLKRQCWGGAQIRPHLAHDTRTPASKGDTTMHAKCRCQHACIQAPPAVHVIGISNGEWVL